MNTLTRKRTHFPRTTASQRKLLFQTWQATGDVELACRKAHVSEGTYYKWKPRFESAGYQALERFASHAPKNPHRTPQTVEQKVIHLRRTYPKWGKRRIADEMAKANNWVPLVSPNTVRRILIDAGLWSQIATQSQAKKPAQARTADKPAQTFNIDLCFVPATHETHEVVSKLPAVSGSSGRLVVERTLDQAAKSEPTWPGRIFEDQNLTYEEAMAGFITASVNKSEPAETSKSPEAAAAAAVLEKKRQIRQEEEAELPQRRTVRQRRQLEDQAWSAIRDQRRAQQAGSPAAPVERQPDFIEQQPHLIEQQPHLIEQQPDSVSPQTDSIAQQTDLLKRLIPAVTQQADSITEQTAPMAKASEQAESYDAQTTLPSVSLPPQARPTALTERSVILVDPVSLATEPVVPVPQQAASLSSLVLAVQPAPSQTTEAAQQTTEAAQQTTEAAQQTTEAAQQATEAAQQTTEAAQQTTEAAQQTTEAAQQATEAPQQTTEAAQQATSVAQQATLAMRLITMRSAAEVMRPATSVGRQKTPVTQSATPVTQSATPVAQSATPVAQSATPVAQSATPVAQSITKEEAPEASQEHISDGQWRKIKSARKAQKEQRKEEDVQWRQKRNSILQRLGELPLITAWVAILVIVDNCTRQCISLPLFMVGPHVTAQMIVDALREVLPTELQYLISDRGIHFRANVFREFCQMGGFQHVLIAKHRPQSNGIAERFVRTLKEWLADKSWTSEEELIALLTEFREYYNDRPHQGIAMPGLSPNEYAKRIWLQ